MKKVKIKMKRVYKSVACHYCGDIQELVFPEYRDNCGDIQLPLTRDLEDSWAQCPKCKKITKYSP